MTRPTIPLLVLALFFGSLSEAHADDLTWNTFVGNGTQDGTGITTDLDGNSYIAGFSRGTFGTPVRAYTGGQDALVAKLDPDGNLLWHTFLGGSLIDRATNVAVSSDGSYIVVSGNSAASWGAPVHSFAGGGDAWIAALNATTGALLWNTFLGGSQSDNAENLVLVSSGPDAGIYVAGLSYASWGSPTLLFSSYGLNPDAFVAKLDLMTHALVWNTFLGSNNSDSASGIAYHNGGVFVSGESYGSWGSPIRPASGQSAGFVARLLPGNGSLVWNTFLGGAGSTSAVSLTVASNDLYVAGYTTSTWGSPVRPFAGNYDGFVARLDVSGPLLANTFLGSSGYDQGLAVTTDGTRVYVTGYSDATWGTPLRPYSGNNDGFVAGLDPALTVVWNTFLGGTGIDDAKGLAYDGSALLVVGQTSSTSGNPDASWGQGECQGCPIDPFHPGYPSYEAFVAKLPKVFADLGITKTDGRLFIVAGEPLTYTITATNHGPDVVPQARVGDVFPADFESPTWTCAASDGATCGAANGSGQLNELVYLPVGGSVTYTVSGTVNTILLGNLLNTAEVSADGVADPVPGNNSATDGSSANRLADLSVTKTDGLAQATPGSADTYTITVHNAGPSSAGVQLTDAFPSDFQNPTWTCTIGGFPCGAGGSGSNLLDTFILAPGEDAVYTVQGTIANTATGVLTNTATVALINGGSDPDLTNNSATDQTSLTAAADLSITKTDGTKIVAAGGSTTYTIVASNAGPSSTTATVSDTFPAALTCNWTCVGAGGGTCTAAGPGNIGDSVNLPAGASVTYTASCTIAGGATGTIKNFATVSSTTFDPNPANNTASDADGVDSAADLVILKTDFRTIAAPGESVIYSILVSNLGPSAVTGATVTDTFPSELQNPTWTCAGVLGATCAAAGSGNINDATVNLPAGSSVTYNLAAKIDPATTATTLTNTATVSSSVPELDPANNTATDTTQLRAGADLLVLKGDGLAGASAGAPLTYSVLVANTGPSDEPNATIQDTLPTPLQNASWTCQASGGAICPAAGGSGNIQATGVHLPAGSQLVFTVQGTVDPSYTGTLTNTATVAASIQDPVVGNNSFTDNTQILAVADLVLAKSDGRSSASGGNLLTYDIVVSNQGPSHVPSATVTDNLPAVFLLASWTCQASGGATCSSSGKGSLNDTLTLPAGSSATYRLRGMVSPSFTGTLTNTARITAAAAFDPNPDNDAATDSTEIFAGTWPPVGATPQPIPSSDSSTLLLLAISLFLAAFFALRRFPGP